MTKRDWEAHRKELDLHEGDRIRVQWHWNYGSTAAKRKIERDGRLDRVDDRGIIFNDKRLSYKSLDSISLLVAASKP